MAGQKRSSRFRLPSWLHQRPQPSSETPPRRTYPITPPNENFDPPPNFMNTPSTSPEASPSPPPTAIQGQKQSSRFRLPSWLHQRPQPSSETPPRRTHYPISPPNENYDPPPNFMNTPPSTPEASPSPPPTERTRSRATPEPVSAPSRASAQPKDASPDTSPSGVAVESPSAATQPPSRAPPQPQTEAQQPPSLASQRSVQTSLPPPPSPPLTATQAQSAPLVQKKKKKKKAQSAPRGGVTQPPLPSENLQPMTHPLPLPPFTQPISSVSEKEQKPDMSEPESKERQPNDMPAQHSEASVHLTEPPQKSTTAEDLPALTQKSDSSVVSSETKSLPGSDEHRGQDTEGKEILEKDRHKEKITGVTEILDAAPGSEVATQMHPSAASDAEQKQLEKEDQTVILNPEDKATVSESRREPNISKGEKASQQQKIREDVSKFLHGMATQQQKLPLGRLPLGEGPAVVTLVGENRGASMRSELAKREEPVHIRRGYKINPDESSTDGEMISEESGAKDSKTREDQVSKAYVNSNVQSVNNSILFNSSVNERDPGVKLAFTQCLGEPYKPNRSMQSPETREAGVIVTIAQKLTYEPTVRRRCLRGLFLEPGDSDPDSPEKPRRHGCRYVCKGKSKDNETDVF